MFPIGPGLTKLYSIDCSYASNVVVVLVRFLSIMKPQSIKNSVLMLETRSHREG